MAGWLAGRSVGGADCCHRHTLLIDQHAVTWLCRCGRSGIDWHPPPPPPLASVNARCVRAVTPRATDDKTDWQTDSSSRLLSWHSTTPTPTRTARLYILTGPKRATSSRGSSRECRRVVQLATGITLGNRASNVSARILARMSVSVSVSASWNSSFTDRRPSLPESESMFYSTKAVIVRLLAAVIHCVTQNTRNAWQSPACSPPGISVSPPSEQ